MMDGEPTSKITVLSHLTEFAAAQKVNLRPFVDGIMEQLGETGIQPKDMPMAIMMLVLCLTEEAIFINTVQPRDGVRIRTQEIEIEVETSQEGEVAIPVQEGMPPAHTMEPWEVVYAESVWVHGPPGSGATDCGPFDWRVICDHPNEEPDGEDIANMERIATCVNFCRDFSNTFLTSTRLRDILPRA